MDRDLIAYKRYVSVWLPQHVCTTARICMS